MTNSSRLNMIDLLTFTTLITVLAATSGALERPPIAEQMAKTYGLDVFGRTTRKLGLCLSQQITAARRTGDIEPVTII
jgi:hypothetical protein